MKDRLNFAVIGCGRVAYKHFGALQDLVDQARLVAVCDIDPVKAQAAAYKYGVPGYQDYHELMAKHPELDVLNVLVPTGYHAAVVQDLAAYGRHIVVEKPMALRASDCEAMIRACQENGCQLYVIYQNRYNPPVQAARLAWERGRFGRPVMSTVRVRWARHQNYYQDQWHGTWALDGGVMSQQASHHLDLLQWFMGPVESIQCQATTRVLDIEVEDTGAALLKFCSGAMGIYEATVAARPDNMEGSLSLLGEKGSVVIGGIAVNELLTWRFDQETPEDEEIRTNVSQVVPNVYGHGHTPNIADVIQALKTGVKPASLVDGEEGKKNIEILNAMYESAATDGEKVCAGVEMKTCRLGLLQN
ncbi:MAG: Gfo/Idh/MocA family oxidoreductase [Desulfohalobiaceae bacterium]